VKYVEIRKIQKVGYSTLSISLPSNWVKKEGLKRGDNVFLKPEKDGSLKLFSKKLLESKESTEEWECNVDMCNDPKMLERIIVGNYILGRDQILLKSSKRIKSEHIKEIRAIVRKLIGLGIIEETPNHILLQCSIDPRKFHLDMLLRRLSIISLTIVKESIQAFVQFDESLARDAIDREDEADMMFFVSMRLLISAQTKKEIAEAIGLSDPLKVLYYGLILRYLELIADYAEETSCIVIELINKGKNVLPNWAIDRINNFNELAHGLVVKSIDCFFSGDIKVANSLSETLTAVEHERDRLTQELPEISRLCCILWNISRVAYNGTGIALKAINNALEKDTEICWKSTL
jgi:phosphate uptake regulator